MLYYLISNGTHQLVVEFLTDILWQEGFRVINEVPPNQVTLEILEDSLEIFRDYYLTNE